jgi:hypothetical protein
MQMFPLKEQGPEILKQKDTRKTKLIAKGLTSSPVKNAFSQKLDRFLLPGNFWATSQNLFLNQI